jgi:hypothetical protein
MVPWVVLAQIILFLGNFQIFKNGFSQRFFFWVKENEESFEIFLNISFKKNQYSKVIKYLADMC